MDFSPRMVEFENIKKCSSTAFQWMVMPVGFDDLKYFEHFLCPALGDWSHHHLEEWKCNDTSLFLSRFIPLKILFHLQHKLTFSMKDIDMSSGLTYFGMNPANGEIRVKTNLTLTTRNRYLVRLIKMLWTLKLFLQFGDKVRTKHEQMDLKNSAFMEINVR
jgi:hypothetical protein